MSIEDNAIKLGEERRKRGLPPEDGRPIIRIMPGQLPQQVEQAEQALIDANNGLYCYGDRLVHIEWDMIRVSGGGTANALRLFESNAANVRERLEKAARFEKWDKRSNIFVVCSCPDEIATTLLARGAWKLPPLLGAVTAPTMRPDGSIIDVPGYDKATAIVFNPHGVVFPTVCSQPSREEALKALAGIERILRGFTFVTPADKAVALSAIITAVVRRAMPVAPMHAFSSPMPGSGKSMLVDIASVIATGWRAAVMSADDDRGNNVELDKRLASALLMGHAIVSIDNMDRPLSGGFLCQCLSQHLMTIRIFSTLTDRIAPNTIMYYATGNNLLVMNDATRRVLVCNVNPNVERPELRHFNFKPVSMALRARPKLVAKCLTIIRAYLSSGDRVSCPELGGYEEWTRLVRSPLIWLGQADPASVIEKVRAGDPALSRTRAVIEAWERVIGRRDVRVRDVIKEANKAAEFGEQDADYYVNMDLHDALRGIAQGSGKEDINPDKLGHWLRKHLNTVITLGSAAYRFAQEEVSDSHGQKWRLERPV